MSSTNALYDAVVVGAGPAGSTAAAEMASGGFRVLLLEEHARIGVPTHCSGLVTPRTLEEAGVGQELVLNRIVGAHIYAPSGKQLTLGNGEPRALVIDRIGLDVALAQKAQERGAELTMATRMVAAEREPGHIAVRLEHRGASTTVRTRMLVGADGAHSRVARAMGMDAGHIDLIRGLGAEGVLPSADPSHVQVFVGKTIAPGWFAWTIPLGDGRVRLGVGTNNGVRPMECLHRAFQVHARQLKGFQPTRWSGGTIPLWSRRKIVQDNVMLVGDAAGQVKPTSGGGIYPSIVSAKMAAEVARTALERGDLSEKALRQYPRAWDKVFGQEYRRGQDLRRVYTSLEDQDFDRLLSIFGQKGLMKLINRYGDIDYPGGMFRRLVRLAPALWLFVRGPLRYAPLWK